MARVVSLTVVNDEGAAEMLCRALRADGIACGHRKLDGGGEGGYAFGGHREILVDEEDLPRAREFLEAGDLAVDECVRCGRPIGEDGGWFPNDTGELEPYCGICAERVFGPA